jgi:hypothetical protein
MTHAKMKILGTLALLTCAVAHPARAQQSADTALDVGTRIRVRSPVLGAKPQIGNLVSLRPDTLLFTREGQTVPTRIALRQVTALDVSAGHASNRRVVEARSLIPEIIGAAAGAAIGIAAGSGSSRMKLALGAAGGLGGYWAGRTYAKITVPSTVEQWTPVALPLRGR